MLIFQVRRALVNEPPTQPFAAIGDALSPAIRPLIRPAVDCQANVLGVPPDALKSAVRGRRMASGLGPPPPPLLTQKSSPMALVDRVLTEQQVGGDEVDCLADISGELVFFELKDKDFNLGNAYSFGAKIGIIRPDHPVIFSTQRVGGDAREHFERARLARRPRPREYYPPEDQPAEIHYIEGLSSLPEGIQALASTIYANDARQVLAWVLPLASLDPEALITALESRRASKPESADLSPPQRSQRSLNNPESSMNSVQPIERQ